MKSAETAVQYYQDKRKEDYYLNGLGKEGRWFGAGAERLGLGRTVQGVQFSNLLNGLSPDGKHPLVQNANQVGRDCCWDFTFNAPKSVSVLWALAPKEIRSQVEESHHQAVQTAVARAEQVGGVTRRGPGGRIKERAQLVWATFQEGTSRVQDPHLHTHAVLLNIGLRADRTSGAIHTPILFQWKMGLGAIYQSELAAQLRQRLGLSIVPDKVAFRIEGVPEDLCRAFSKRRAAIEKRMEERGFSGAVAAKTVAKDTRPKKEELSPTVLFESWNAVAATFGWGPMQAGQLVRSGHSPTVTREQLRELVREAVRSVPPGDHQRARLVRQATRIALTHGADGSMLFDILSPVVSQQGRHTPSTSPGSKEAHANRDTKRHDRRQDQDVGRVERPTGPEQEVRPPDHVGIPPVPSVRNPVHQESQRTHDGSPNMRQQPAAPRHPGPRISQSQPEPGLLHPAASERVNSSAGDPSPTPQHPGHGEPSMGGKGAGAAKKRATDRAGKEPRHTAPLEWTPAKIRELDPRLANTPWNRKMLSLKWKSLAYSSSIESPIPEALTSASPEQKERNRQFRSAFDQWLSSTPPAQKTVKQMAFRAVGLAHQFSADTQGLHDGIRKAREENQRLRRGFPGPKSFIRIEWKRMVPKAPDWSPVSKWKAPVVVIGPRDPRWWSIRWKADLKIAELRIQDRVVFPNAANWTGLRGLTLPAFRLTPKKSKFKNKTKRQQPTRSKSSPESRPHSKDQGHSH